MQDPPPPPRALVDVLGVVVVGTALWFVIWAVFLVAHLVADRPLDIWFTSTLVGWLLGLVGLLVFGWQRRAARRGSRLAQRGLET